MPRLPIVPETQTHNGERRVSGQAYTLKLFTPCPNKGDTAARRFIGRVTIRPGPVAPGHIAAVRHMDGCLTLRRIYYYRDEGGREFVRLEKCRRGAHALRYPLSEVIIEGTVTHAYLALR